MKKYFFIVMILFISSAFYIIDGITDNYDMPVDAKTGKITYKEVINEPGKSAELYDKAYAWAKKYFVNISSTIKHRDKAAGILKGNTRFKVQTTDKKGRKVEAGAISYDFTIECKENKYRILETNFKQANNSGNPVEDWFNDVNEKAKPLHKEVFQQIDAKAKAMIISLKAGMKPVPETTDDW